MQVRRIEPVDRLSRAGGSLLLYERELIQLGPIGTAIFDAAADVIEVGELADQLAATFGAPAEGSAAKATASAVDDLIARGVLAVHTEGELPSVDR